MKTKIIQKKENEKKSIISGEIKVLAWGKIVRAELSPRSHCLLLAPGFLQILQHTVQIQETQLPFPVHSILSFHPSILKKQDTCLCFACMSILLAWI